MKIVIKCFAALSFLAVISLGTGFAQSTKEVVMTRAAVEKAETGTATTAAVCCEGENANRNRCCAITRAKAMASQTVQRPAGELKSAEISEAVKNNAARKPESAESEN